MAGDMYENNGHCSQSTHNHAVSSDMTPREVLALAKRHKCHATDLISRSLTDARLNAGKNAGCLSDGCSPQPDDELVAEPRLRSTGCAARATYQTTSLLSTDDEADPRLSSLAASWVWDRASRLVVTASQYKSWPDGRCGLENVFLVG